MPVLTERPEKLRSMVQVKDPFTLGELRTGMSEKLLPKREPPPATHRGRD